MKVFITGISSGIGRELTKQLISLNHEVWGLARREELLISLQKEVGNDKFFYSVCDIADEESVKKAISQLEDKNFVPDVVILNAGIFPNDIEPVYNHQSACQTFEVNLCGSLRWVDYWLNKFQERNSGQFIAICSTAAFRANLRGIAYPASKAALAMAMRGFRLKYRKSTIKFSTIYFGPLTSQMWEGKKNVLVATPQKAARHILKIIKSKKFQSYFPAFSTFIFRITKFLPDSIFSKITEKTLK